MKSSILTISDILSEENLLNKILPTPKEHHLLSYKITDLNRVFTRPDELYLIFCIR